MPVDDLDIPKKIISLAFCESQKATIAIGLVILNMLGASVMEFPVLFMSGFCFDAPKVSRFDWETCLITIGFAPIVFVLSCLLLAVLFWPLLPLQ